MSCALLYEDINPKKIEIEVAHSKIPCDYLQHFWADSLSLVKLCEALGQEFHPGLEEEGTFCGLVNQGLRNGGLQAVVEVVRPHTI
jgi:hypothetical protein